MRLSQCCKLAMLMVLPLASVAAGPTYTFERKLVVGQKWSQTTTSDSDDEGEGGYAKSFKVTKINSREVTVVATKDDLATDLLTKYGDDCRQISVTDGQRKEFPIDGAGTTVKMFRQGKEIVVDKLPVYGDELVQTKLLMEPSKCLFPSGPVSVGDSWDGNADEFNGAYVFLPGAGSKTTLKCKLEKTSTVNHRPAFQVSVKSSGTTGKAPGIEMKFEITGTIDIDQKTGQVLNADLKCTSKGGGEINGRKIKLSSVAHVTSELKPLDGYPNP